MNPKVSSYISSDRQWQEELQALRAILLDCRLTEEFKWNKPCYTFQNTNLVSIARLKNHCWIMFFKGALLSDPAGVLVKAGENSQSMRVIPFTNVGKIVELQALLKATVYEAIEAEKAGLKVPSIKHTDLIYPEEFNTKLDKMPDLKTAFEALTPGRQRGYNLYFTGAKQSRTRESRIEKCVPRILAGKGLNDR